jgi:hypothetical protein
MNYRRTLRAKIEPMLDEMIAEGDDLQWLICLFPHEFLAHPLLPLLLLEDPTRANSVWMARVHRLALDRQREGLLQPMLDDAERDWLGDHGESHDWWFTQITPEQGGDDDFTVGLDVDFSFEHEDLSRRSNRGVDIEFELGISSITRYRLGRSGMMVFEVTSPEWESEEYRSSAREV